MWWGTPKCVSVSLCLFKVSSGKNAPIHFALVQHWHSSKPLGPRVELQVKKLIQQFGFFVSHGFRIFPSQVFIIIHVYQQLHVNKCHVMSISYHRYMNCRVSFMTWQPQSREEHAISRREGLDAFGDTAGECLWQRLSNAWPYRRSPAEDSYSLAWGNKTLILLCWP